jgi:4-amino-4-deoxy-L-arabinose transferase-like glycosyltransferase
MQPAAQAAPRHRGVRRLAPPRSLAALLVMVVVVGLAWALVVPPFQAPDEPTHFAYIQSLAESFKLPNVPGRPGLSSDEQAADAAVGAIRGGFYPGPSPPSWRQADEKAYLALEHGRHPLSRSDGSGFTTSTGNPPLYYALAAVPYLIDHGGSTFGQLYAIRIAEVLLLALTAVAAWLLAGEVFGRRRLPQLVCAAVAALLPMSTFISTAVTPDALLITSWTFALWLGARVINHRARGWDALALCAVTAAAILTKATSYALVGPAAIALVLGCLRRPAGERLVAIARTSAAGLALAVPVLAWVALAPGLGGVAITQEPASSHPLSISQFLSYLWQFYLPKLPFLASVPGMTPHLPVYDIWVRQVTGDFGWLVVSEPGWMYPLATAVAAALAIAVVFLLSRLRDPRHLALLAFFGLTALALLVLLHVTGYQALITGSGTFLQGRYLLPAIGLLGLAVGLVVIRLPFRMRAGACAVVLTGLLGWQVISLAAVVQTYYL